MDIHYCEGRMRIGIALRKGVMTFLEKESSAIRNSDNGISIYYLALIDRYVTTPMIFKSGVIFKRGTLGSAEDANPDPDPET